MYVAAITIAIVVAIIVAARALIKSSQPRSAPTLSSSQAEEQIERLICAGRKIEAIKLHRQARGSGLREAKEAIEAETTRLQLEGRL